MTAPTLSPISREQTLICEALAKIKDPVKLKLIRKIVAAVVEAGMEP